MSQTPSGLSRRTLFAGAGTAGTLAALATLSASQSVPVEVQTAELKPAPERGGGYSLSEHVKHYYRTTRI
jgi:hypothetical protein